MHLVLGVLFSNSTSRGLGACLIALVEAIYMVED